jgi:hypothetical protein
VKGLLDTCTFLWIVTGSKELSPAAACAIAPKSGASEEVLSFEFWVLSCLELIQDSEIKTQNFPVTQDSPLLS